MKNTTIHPIATFLYLILGIIGVSALSNAIGLYTTYSYATSGCETLSYSDYGLQYVFVLASCGLISVIALLVLYIKLLRNKCLQLHWWNKAGVWCLLATLVVPMIINVLLSFVASNKDIVMTVTSYFVWIVAIGGFFLLVFKTDLPIIVQIVLIAWKPAVLLIDKLFAPSQDWSTLEAWEQSSLQSALFLTLDIIVIVVALVAFHAKKATLQSVSSLQQ